MKYLLIVLMFLLSFLAWLSIIIRQYNYSLYQAKVNGENELSIKEFLNVIWGNLAQFELLWKIKLDPHPNIENEELARMQKRMNIFFYIQYASFLLLLLGFYLVSKYLSKNN